ncbi:MAG: hypothetical protein L0H80_03370 [Propionibacterium sp.]|nr:hypothetical protein [Propionibacterium sp.]
MSPTTLALIVAIVLVLVGLLVAFLGWRRRRSMRTVLRGLSLGLLSAGLWVTGILSLLADAARGIWHWVRDQHLDTRMWTGIGIAAAGVVVVLISSALAPVGRAEGRRRREALLAPQSAQQPVTGAAATAPSGQAAGPGAGLDDPDEDAEITAILKNHGIH